MSYASRIEPSFTPMAAGVPGGSAGPTPVARRAVAGPVAAAWAGAAVAAVLLALPCLFGRVVTPGEPQPKAATAAPLDVGVTGALATPAQSGEAQVGPQELKPQGFALVLAEASTAETLWNWWRILQQRHRSSIGALGASVSQSPETPGRHRLTLGPVQNAAAAFELCGRWRAEGATCHVARADGAKL